jgi:hypothetical protein
MILKLLIVQGSDGEEEEEDDEGEVELTEREQEALLKSILKVIKGLPSKRVISSLAYNSVTKQ